MDSKILYKEIIVLLKSKFIRDTSTLVVGTALAQIVTMVAMPFLTRIYRVEEFGLFSIYAVIVSVASSIACLSYEPAIMLPKDPVEGKGLLIASIGIAFFITIIFTGLIFIGGKSLVNYLKVPELYSILWWAPLNVFFIGLFQALTYWNMRLQSYKNISFSRGWQSGVTAVAQLGTGWLGFGVSSLVGGQVCGQIISCGILGRSHIKIKKLPIATVDFPFYFSLLRRYKNFPLFSTWGTLMNVAASQNVPVILSFYFGSTVTGYYFLAYRLISVPMALVGNAIGQVLFQRAAVELQQQGNLSRFVARGISGSILVWTPLFFLFAILSPSFFGLVFGSRWTESGYFAQILTPLFLCQMITSPLSMVLIILEKQQVVTIIQGLLLLGSVATLLLAGYFSLGALAVLGGYAICQGIIYLIYLFAIMKYSSTPMSMILGEMGSGVRGEWWKHR